MNNIEIAILNCSLLQVMTEYAAYIDVPESDIAESRVYVARQENAETGIQLPPLTRQGTQWINKA